MVGAAAPAQADNKMAANMTTANSERATRADMAFPPENNDGFRQRIDFSTLETLSAPNCSRRKTKDPAISREVGDWG
jgi:hypothetical protein